MIMKILVLSLAPECAVLSAYSMMEIHTYIQHLRSILATIQSLTLMHSAIIFSDQMEGTLIYACTPLYYSGKSRPQLFKHYF